MLLEPTPTPFDLRWRMFGIPCRVHPSFWLFSAFLGYTLEKLGFGYLALWVGCMFLSILVHELGHVFAGRAFGQPGRLVLYWLGGLAMGNYHHTRRWQRIVIYLAGPGAGFVLLGLVLVVEKLINDHDRGLIRWNPRADVLLWDPDAISYLGGAFFFLKAINLLWGLVNLIPIFPLDGGQVMREICTKISPRAGLKASFGVSFVLAGLLAFYSALKTLRPELPYPPFNSTLNILLFGVIAVQNYQMMQEVDREQRRWERDQDWGDR